MYAQGNAVLRTDLMGVVEESLNTEDLLIGTRVLPPEPVDGFAGQYPKLTIGAANMLRNEVKARGRTADYARLDRAWGTDTYTTREYGLEGLVGDVDKADIGRFFDMEATESRLLQRQLLLAHEVRVRAKIIDTAVFSIQTTTTAYTVANVIGNGVNGFDIGLDVDIAKNALRTRGESVNPNDLVLVVSNDIFLRARASQKLQNRVRGVLSPDTQIVLGEKDVAAALGVREVLVGRAVVDNSAQGATSSLGSIWANTYMWLGQAKSGNIFAGGAGRTMFWRQNGSIVTVESYRAETKRATVVRVRHDTDEKITNANAGQLIDCQG